eukprot:6213609-Pleurochrysis_carterae.AAC.2
MQIKSLHYAQGINQPIHAQTPPRSVRYFYACLLAHVYIQTHSTTPNLHQHKVRRCTLDCRRAQVRCSTYLRMLCTQEEIKEVAARGYGCMILSEEGDVWNWGWNEDGRRASAAPGAAAHTPSRRSL